MMIHTGPNQKKAASTHRPAPQAVVVHANKPAFLGIILAMIFMASVETLSAAGPAPVNLLSTVNFTILAGAGITTTGGGTITGDVGASPITGAAIGATCVQVVGTIYAVDGAGPSCAVINPTLLSAAKGDLTTAFNDAAGRMPVPTGTNLNPGLIPGSGNIGGMTLAPGLYKFTVTALITGSDVTLTGGPDDVWIFQCAQDLQLGSGIHVILAGGAQPRNIFWQVGTSAVLGTSSVFSGTILAGQSITMGTTSMLTGRALASSAGIVFNGSGATLPATAAGLAVQQSGGTNLVSGSGTNDFGMVVPGTSSNLTFTITNAGSTAITGLAVKLAGVDSALFTVITNPASTLATNATSTFTVLFAPLSTGAKIANAQITSDGVNNNPFSINLAGTGEGGPVVSSTNVFVIAVSPVVLNPQTGLFEETVRLTNSGSNTVAATRLLVQLLPGDVQLYYAAGSTNGYPFVQWNFPLAPAASVDFTIEYYRSSRQAIPQPEFVPQEASIVTLTAAGNTMAIDRVLLLNGRYLIEFSAIPGRTYAVQYSTNTIDWISIIPAVTAPANRVQWYDDGPPETESKPGAVGNRFYRVVQLP